MHDGHKVVDVHGHVSRPPHVKAYVQTLMGLRTPTKMNISDELAEPHFQNHLKQLDERSIDFQLIGPRPVDEWHWMPFFLQEVWARSMNDFICQSVRLHPDRFVGMAQLPQNSKMDTSHVIAELDRCVNELGFVGAYLNPDPGGDRQAPGLHDEYWWPLYKRASQLDVPLMVHPCPSEDPRIQVIPHNYQLNNVIEEYISTMLLMYGGVFDRFPKLKIVVCHCGGMLTRFLATDTHHSGPEKDFSNNLYFDCCAYNAEFLEAAFKQRGVDQMLFGSEVPGSGGAIRPETGRPGDDLVPVIEGMSILSAEDKQKVFNGNPLKVFTKVKSLVK